MKTKHIILVVTFFSFLCSNAQITKGNWMVGGSGNFSSYENKNQENGTEIIRKGIGINFSPKIGYFFLNKVAGGTSMTISYTKPKESESSIGYGFGPFLRYYVLNEDKQVNFFGEASYTFGETKSGDFKNTSNGYGFKAGSAIFFNSSVALEIALEYSSSSYKSQSSGSNSFNNLQIGLGFQIHLEK